VLCRHNRPDISGIISLTPPVELVEEPDQRDEILDAETGPSAGEDEEGVGTLDVGPACRQRLHPRVTGLPEEHPVLAPGMGIPDEIELATQERMERVGHTKSLRIAPTGCS
jgi:hypothetical protein